MDLQKITDVVDVPDTFKILGIETVVNKYDTLVLKIEYKKELFKVWCTQPLQRFVTSPLVQNLLESEDFTYIPISVKSVDDKLVYSIE